MTSIPKPDTWREPTSPKPFVLRGEPGEPGTDPVGALEIAYRLGLVDRTVHMIRRRGQLPAPDYDAVNGSRAWEWSTILWWAGETGRLKGDDFLDMGRGPRRSEDLHRQYVDMFGQQPPDLTGGRKAPGVGHLVDEHEGLPLVPSLP